MLIGQMSTIVKGLDCASSSVVKEVLVTTSWGQVGIVTGKLGHLSTYTK
jgi:hypothetical protein